MKQVVSALIEKGNYSPTMNGVLSLVLEDKMNSFALKEYLSQNGLDLKDIKQETLKVIIDYANVCLEDDILTDDEMRIIGLLKIFLQVEDGDFYKFGLETEVKNTLSLQLKKMYSDHIISKEEALMKTDLQALFGLSYDQFLKIVNDVAIDALDRGADIKDLDTFM